MLFRSFLLGHHKQSCLDLLPSPTIFFIFFWVLIIFGDVVVGWWVLLLGVVRVGVTLRSSSLPTPFLRTFWRGSVCLADVKEQLPETKS